MTEPPSHDWRVQADRQGLESQLEVEIADALREARLPHVVVCTDVASGRFTLEGPYPNGCLASMAADRESRRDPTGLSGLRFTVQPVYPPFPQALDA